MNYFCLQNFLVLTIYFFLIMVSYGETRKRNFNNQTCTIKLPNDIPINEPLYLKKIHNGKYEFLNFLNQTNIIPINTKLILLCHGKRNHIIQTLQQHQYSNSTELMCKSRNHFHNIENNSIVNLRNLNCTKTIMSDLNKTKIKCSNNRGYLHEIGYRINSKQFLTIFNVCYDNLTATTFFSVHKIDGAVIKYAVKDNRRRNFISTGLNNLNINQMYKKQNQINHFNKLLGSNQYFNGTMYLARGHLTPDADFILPNFQLTTYYYINVAPEFQIINAGNWLRIENMVRALAADYGDDFLIYTGIYEILKLKNSDGIDVPLYLDNNNRIEVPKWFWKVVKNLKTNSGIAFITLNNPFAKFNEIHEFCPNVCEKASLVSQYFTDIRKGYTFCCEIDTFKEIVHDLPSNFTVKSLLNCGRVNNLILNNTNLF